MSATYDVMMDLLESIGEQCEADPHCIEGDELLAVDAVRKAHTRFRSTQLDRRFLLEELADVTQDPEPVLPPWWESDQIPVERPKVAVASRE